MSYHAKYDEQGNKVYEVENGVVLIDELPPVADAGYFVMNDIKPYRSMIDGSEISSRSKHNAHLRQHKMVEVGNEKPKPKVVNHKAIREKRRRHVADAVYGRTKRTTQPA